MRVESAFAAVRSQRRAAAATAAGRFEGAALVLSSLAALNSPRLGVCAERNGMLYSQPSGRRALSDAHSDVQET